MAAGVASSMAQVTYSQNIVGYATVVLPGNGQYTLVANPFDDGNGNFATNILNAALPKQSQYLTWGGASYTTVQKLAAGWPGTASAQLAPGQGFFVRNGGVASGAPDITNVFVGSVITPVGTSVTNSLALGFTLQGSPIPYGGNLAISGQAGGDTNMDFGSPLTKQSQILTWNGVAQAFSTVQKVGSAWGGTASVGVGEGFFINNKNGPATNVVETLNP